MNTHQMVIGSEKQLPRRATIVGQIDPKSPVEITLLLRPQSNKGAVKDYKMAIQRATTHPNQRRHIRHKDFVARFGANPSDVLKVRRFAREYGLSVIDICLAKRSVKLAGTLDCITKAFKPNLIRCKIGSRFCRSRSGGISVPNELSEIVRGVFGIDDRPVASPRSRSFAHMYTAGRGQAPGSIQPGRRSFRSPQRGVPLRRHSARNRYPTIDEVSRRYNFPKGLDGYGQCIAIIELNNIDNNGNIIGTGFRVKDLKSYFQTIKKPIPVITEIGVNGGSNKPGRCKSFDAEVMLDIEVAGTVAPGSSIAVYFAPNNERGFLDAVNAAVHDRIRNPSVISISWALGDEEFWTGQARNMFDQILRDAAALGITVCCASGDSGSTTGNEKNPDGRPHLYFPVAEPYILACGGTQFMSRYRERTWRVGSDAATGGGVSTIYDRPSYQSTAHIPKSPKGTIGRGVPDVAGYAMGYRVTNVGGTWGFEGGTSAVSPLWAGLIALINQRLESLGKPRAGFINPLLYQRAPSSGVLHDIVQGDNDTEHLGRYKAHKGWDACTGLGTPDGTKLMEALGG